MVHNKPTSQELVIEVNGLQLLLHNFTSDPDETSRTNALGAISSLIRNNKLGITAFREENGYAALRDALSSESVRLQRPCLLPSPVQEEILDMLTERGSVSVRLLQQLRDRVQKWYHDEGSKRNTNLAVVKRELPKQDDLAFKFEYVHPYLDGVHRSRNRTLRTSCFNSRKLSPVFTGGPGVDEVPPIWVDRAGLKTNITENFSRQSKFTLNSSRSLQSAPPSFRDS